MKNKQEVDFNSQRDTMAKFELAELKKVHEEMAAALNKMKQQNKNTVDPVLNALRQNV